MLAQAQNDWGWVVPVVIVIISVLSYLWNALNAAANKQNRPAQNRGERPLGQQPPAGNPQPAKETVQDKLNAEIEEFLRRANERRADKNRRAGQPVQAEKQLPPPEQAAKLRNRKDEPREKSRRQRESVSQSVEEHLGSRKFESREQKLAEDVKRSEFAMSEHVQNVFDHQLGSLGATGAEAAPTSGETKATQSAEQKAEALAVAGLLVSPENLRRAVILREILERPVDRW